jgi:alpha-glucosidase
MQMARATHQGLQRLRPNSRPFVLSRSGTAGIQRYAAVWTGDNASTWEHLQLAIPMCLNLSMSGVPFVGVDIGGFRGSCHGELLVRFAQLGAFLPFCRNHNKLTSPDQEPWAFGEPYESAYRKAIELRYHFLPYLYTLFREASTCGAPVIRPLFYHYTDDERACEIDTAFLVGESLLSAPITQEEARSRAVYLPEGSTWFSYWDQTSYQGGQTYEMTAPLDQWPLLIRGNSIIPRGPLMQWCDQNATDPLTLLCYMQEWGEAHLSVYEDDGSTLAYQGGSFAQTVIQCRAKDDAIILTIEEDHARYRPQREWYEVVIHISGQTHTRQVKAGQGRITLRF